ncbi:MAG TPA: hypothetical protein VNN80_00935, partial [Polyangiaceae bacterium]|nr:hypothetical protein [Polyangiaceae bacterium]
MQSCGAELAESAVVPERLAALMQHVSENLIAHADWVGAGSAEAAQEQAGLRLVAREYRAIAAAGRQAAAAMRSLAGLPAAAHDPARWDREAFARWMHEKIVLQRELAALLLEHA